MLSPFTTLLNVEIPMSNLEVRLHRRDVVANGCQDLVDLSGVGVWGSGFRVQGGGLLVSWRVWGVGARCFRVRGLQAWDFAFQGLGFEQKRRNPPPPKVSSQKSQKPNSKTTKLSLRLLSPYATVRTPNLEQ